MTKGKVFETEEQVFETEKQVFETEKQVFETKSKWVENKKSNVVETKPIVERLPVLGKDGIRLVSVNWSLHRRLRGNFSTFHLNLLTPQLIDRNSQLSKLLKSR